MMTNRSRKKGTNRLEQKGTNAISTLRPRLRLGARAIEDYATALFEEGQNPLTLKLLAQKFNQSPERCRRRIHQLVKKGVLFTPKGIRHRPQWYFPSIIEAEVYAWLAESTKKGTNHPIGVNRPEAHTMPAPAITEEQRYAAAYHMLETNFVELLAGQPIQIHNLQFVTDIPPARYDELNIPEKKPRCKVYRQAIGPATVAFTFYPVGTVIISIENSKTPFNFQTEEDHTRFFAFLGAVRHQLALAINDPRERAIVSLDRWYFTVADKNKDVPVDHTWQFHAYNFQVKHLDFALHVYIKEMGGDTVKRFESRQGFKDKQLLEVIHDHLDPTSRLERIERQIIAQGSLLEKLVNAIFPEQPNTAGSVSTYRQGYIA